MKLIDSLLERNSARGLIEPFPDSNEMEKIYQAALRAPDHAKLKPARFIQITGQGLNKLSSVFYDFAKIYQSLTGYEHILSGKKNYKEKYYQNLNRFEIFI